MVSDTRCARGGGGYVLVFDRINRIEGRREERGRRGNHAESAEGRGNSDCWQGYANAPPLITCFVTKRDRFVEAVVIELV